MTKTFARRTFLASSLITMGALACSSSTPAAPGAPYLAGTYRAVSAGPIAEITFYSGDHYQLVDGTCADALLGASITSDTSAPPSLASCNELGTYVVDAAGTSLTLSPTDGSARHLPFSASLVGESYGPTSDSLTPTEGLHVQGGTGLTSGSDASLTSGADASLTQEAGVLVPCAGGTLTKSGVPLTHAFSAGSQQLVGGSPPSGKPDPTQGGQWSCTGSYDGFISNAYYLTTFGCSGKSPAFQDSGDNCCGAGAPVAAAQGLCGSLKPATNCSNSCASNSSCNSWRSKQSGATAASFKCEEMVNYYSTGAVSYGLGTHLCLSTPGGKGIVVFVYDDGPSCSIERRVDAHVLDVSPPTAEYLFGESQVSAPEKKAVFVTSVSLSTPLGPNDSCASAAPQGAADSGSSASGGDSGASNGAGDSGSASGADASCAAAMTCKSDSDCNPSGPLGLACSNGTCVAGCHSAAQCPSGNTCSGATSGGVGTCQAGGSGKACTNDGACNPGGNGAGMICSGGSCAAGCHASWECPGNTSCHSGQCR